MNKLAEKQGIRAAIAHCAEGMRTATLEAPSQLTHSIVERRVRFDAAADDSGRHFSHGSGVNAGQAY